METFAITPQTDLIGPDPSREFSQAPTFSKRSPIGSTQNCGASAENLNDLFLETLKTTIMSKRLNPWRKRRSKSNDDGFNFARPDAIFLTTAALAGGRGEARIQTSAWLYSVLTGGYGASLVCDALAAKQRHQGAGHRRNQFLLPCLCRKSLRLTNGDSSAGLQDSTPEIENNRL